MKEIELKTVLSQGQEYVADATVALGVEVIAVEHDKATNTCHEKAAILGWDAEQVVKAVFFYRGEEMYGFVFPELGSKDKPLYLPAKEIIPRVLGISKNQAKKFNNSYCPEGMEYGTCTPFVLQQSFSAEERRLIRMLVHDRTSLDNKIVDISIGGAGDTAHRTSVHLPYRGIYDILHHTFGDKIRKVELFGGD
ncbi:hypothetical protein GF323_06250 [Candidatus Woesearchaeota archaeon]|nr:hypothetical protein [Candidatus Woesearchaeota archaeon]